MFDSYIYCHKVPNFIIPGTESLIRVCLIWPLGGTVCTSFFMSRRCVIMQRNFLFPHVFRIQQILRIACTYIIFSILSRFSSLVNESRQKPFFVNALSRFKIALWWCVCSSISWNLRIYHSDSEFEKHLEREKSGTILFVSVFLSSVAPKYIQSQ